MKAVLVVEMPEEYMGSVIDVKLYGKEKVVRERYVNKLRPLPQKKEVEVNEIEDLMHTEFQTMDVITDKFIADVRFETEKLIALGWNACLKEIEK